MLLAFYKNGVTTVFRRRFYVILILRDGDTNPFPGLILERCEVRLDRKADKQQDRQTGRQETDVITASTATRMKYLSP